MAGLLRFSSLEPVEGLAHALTTRAAHTMGGADGEVHRDRVARALGFAHIATLCQVHGDRVVVLDEMPSEPPAADAVVLRRPGVLAGVLGADCPLVLLVAPAQRVLALVHAGWRGTVAGVVPATVCRLEAVCGVRPSALRVGIGPSMCGARYEVGDEVIQAVRRSFTATGDLLRPTRPGHALLDLGRALETQLTELGVNPARIERCTACTWEAESTFFSYRRDGSSAGRHALVAGWLHQDFTSDPRDPRASHHA